MWIVGRHEPNRAALALDQLRRAGFGTYMPMMRERVTLRGRVVVREAPVFASYIFIETTGGWYQARWAIGMSAIVMSGEHPARADAAVAEVRRREHGGLIELERFRPGDLVRVTRGVFEGLAGLYAGQSGADRVAVLLALLGGQRRVTLRAGDVEARYSR